MCWHQHLSFVGCEDGSAYFEKAYQSMQRKEKRSVSMLLYIELEHRLTQKKEGMRIGRNTSMQGVFFYNRLQDGKLCEV